MKKTKKNGWWKDRFVTLMLVPERTRKVHKLVLPFFALKLGFVLIFLAGVFLVLIGVDYVHVLGQMAENKRLKGENFKLQQEVQLIRNKVESMESTVERVRNYAKKIQMLTGDAKDKKGMNKILEGLDEEIGRTPAGKRRGDASKVIQPDPNSSLALDSRLTNLRRVSLKTEVALSALEDRLMLKSAITNAMPTLFPLVGRISSAYGFRRHPHDGVYKKHHGVDIVAEPGTPVRAPADGVVVYSGVKRGYGKVVVIDHGHGMRTVLAHNSKFFVNRGSRVKRGETIAHVGQTGRATGPHLHYEIRKNGVAVNPMTFVNAVQY